jgi:hypothetical protein
LSAFEKEALQVITGRSRRLSGFVQPQSVLDQVFEKTPWQLPTILYKQTVLDAE